MEHDDEGVVELGVEGVEVEALRDCGDEQVMSKGWWRWGCDE